MAGLTERMKELAGKKKDDTATANEENQKEIEAAKLKEQEQIAEEERLKAEEEKKSKGKKKDDVDGEKKKLSREEILAALSEEMGEEVKDFAEIKARFAKPLDLEEQKTLQQREFADKIKFAVDNKIATPEQILEWQKIQDEEDEALTYSEFAKAEKKSNPKSTEDEIKSKYTKYFFQTQIEDEDKDQTKAEKAKWNEIGKGEIKTRAQQVKDKAKRNLEKVDTQFSFHKEYVRKANELTGSIQDVLKDYSNTFSIAVVDPESKENVDMQIEVEADVPKLVENFLAENNRFNSIIQNGKQGDKKFLRELADAYIKTTPQYQDKRDDALMKKFRSLGVEETKIGTTKQIPAKEGEGSGTKTRDSKIEKMVNAMKEKEKATVKA